MARLGPAHAAMFETLLDRLRNEESPGDAIKATLRRYPQAGPADVEIVADELAERLKFVAEQVLT